MSRAINAVLSSDDSGECGGVLTRSTSSSSTSTGSRAWRRRRRAGSRAPALPDCTSATRKRRASAAGATWGGRLLCARGERCVHRGRVSSTRRSPGPPAAACNFNAEYRGYKQPTSSFACFQLTLALFKKLTFVTT